MHPVKVNVKQIIQDLHSSLIKSDEQAKVYSDMKIIFEDGFLLYSRLLYSFIDPSLVDVFNNLCCCGTM